MMKKEKIVGNTEREKNLEGKNQYKVHKKQWIETLIDTYISSFFN